MVVSMDRPFKIAHMDELPPRWQLTSRRFSRGRPRISGARSLDVLVRRAVEAVAPHAVLLAPVRRHAVADGVLGHGRVEFGLEGGHQRHARHGVAEGADAGQIDRVVHRRGGQVLLQRRDQLVVDHEGAAVARAGEHGLEGHGVDGGAAGVDFADGVAVVRDALQAAARQRALRRHLEHLVLERGRAEIRDKNVHFWIWNCALITLRFRCARAWNGPWMAAHCWLNLMASRSRAVSGGFASPSLKLARPR